MTRSLPRLKGHPHIIAVNAHGRRDRTDFCRELAHRLELPEASTPQGTCLFGITIPPSGGDTLFANQYMALEQMPDELREPH
jgi:taurine dioxygenase